MIGRYKNKEGREKPREICEMGEEGEIRHR